MQPEYQVIIDSQKETARSNRIKDKIIILLIVLMFLEGLGCYLWHLRYESQFDYVTMETVDQDVDLSSEGDSASAEYNDVEGDQYNDNSAHNEGGDE